MSTPSFQFPPFSPEANPILKRSREESDDNEIIFLSELTEQLVKINKQEKVDPKIWSDKIITVYGKSYNLKDIISKIKEIAKKEIQYNEMYLLLATTEIKEVNQKLRVINQPIAIDGDSHMSKSEKTEIPDNATEDEDFTNCKKEIENLHNELKNAIERGYRPKETKVQSPEEETEVESEEEEERRPNKKSRHEVKGNPIIGSVYVDESILKPQPSGPNPLSGCVINAFGVLDQILALLKSLPLSEVKFESFPGVEKGIILALPQDIFAEQIPDMIRTFNLDNFIEALSTIQETLKNNKKVEPDALFKLNNWISTINSIKANRSSLLK